MTKLVWGLGLLAGSVAAAGEVPFDDPRWQFEAEAAEVVEYLGRSALRLDEGHAWLPDVALTDGFIEFDVAFGPERGFSGAMLRYQGPGDFENFYLRPHQSGKPDASQYTPELAGVSGWQLYHGPAYAAPFEYRYHEWMSVRIAVAGNRAELTVDGVRLAIPALKRDSTGGAIGLRSGFAPAWFSNFRYSEKLPEDFPTGDLEPIPQNDAPGLVREWRVSEAFATDRRPHLTLEPSIREGLSWQTLASEPEGFVNLARTTGVDADHRAVLAEFTIEAGEAGTRLLSFGYSDAARVFLNGSEIYRGSNAYRSRDYRYLGTIGLFDAVPLRLKPGVNTVTFVVAEAFGGWGVMAAIE